MAVPYQQAEPAFVPTESMLVQEGDPPMGRPVILSKEANLLVQPPSASWGPASGVTPITQNNFTQSSSVPVDTLQGDSVQATGITSHVPVEAPTQVEQVICMLLSAVHSSASVLVTFHCGWVQKVMLGLQRDFSFA